MNRSLIVLLVAPFALACQSRETPVSTTEVTSYVVTPPPAPRASATPIVPTVPVEQLPNAAPPARERKPGEDRFSVVAGPKLDDLTVPSSRPAEAAPPPSATAAPEEHVGPPSAADPHPWTGKNW